ncbi:MBL fold metallo-hydrolase [Mameliella alba]|uniref:MBL fold metallo-hydrolase n=1 Tax=Mameliella alba TaxID=561184 RepID=UPI000B531F2E|nr:MBL fold metallo-hydrolase [Mameliella alba]MBY6122699.1 MBL fold metallo-hydrolase [Mameliella alba]OWV37848.1 MBL fold metallo-hydrolase [Mameliella alba]OWV51686.1 MBL fold metallo-hydrolase [Mameliella alba]
MRRLALAAATLALWPLGLMAQILEPQQVAPGIWAIEGPAAQRDPQNLGNNATFGLIETSEGAVLVDPGGSWKGASTLHDVVRGLTDQPVTHVINTGGQDHRWLGNGYWQSQGAQVITSAAAFADQKDRASLQLTMLDSLIGSAGLTGTEPSQPDVIFAASHELTLGGTRIEIRHVGPAHTPGDSLVWLPETRTVFTGDVVYVGRVLGVMSFSDSAHWLDAFSEIEALEPVHLIPGHGPATDLATAQRDTWGYLTNLRAGIRDHIDAGGDILGAVDVDQSDFAYLDQFDALARRNAQTVFEQMEWE